MEKILFIIAVIILSGSFANAQQDPMFTHYSFNTLAINPAYAGSRDALTITGLHRSQWVSFKGAPITQTITAHSPIFNDKVGIGLSVLNDKIGPSNTSSFYLDFSYKIKINEKAKLAFGLKAGLNFRVADLKSLTVEDVTDPLFESDVKSELLPNFGFGLYYFTDKYYFGVSIPKLMENDFKTNSTSSSVNLASEKKHYFLIGGAVFNINEDFKLRPTAFVKITTGAPIEADLTSLVYYKEKIWFGPMFRTGDAFGAMVGMYVTDELAIGYSFDWSMTNTTFKYNAGSHEIMIRYDFFFKTNKKIRSPRYF